VKKHMTHILDKLGAPNRTAAAFYTDRFSTAEE
jgi:DNA-binding NarL/FixJ family response regulator